MLRRSLIKCVPARGGGHDHPDHPHPGYYQHKRLVTVKDSFLWVMDGTCPEYLLDFMSPQYQYSQLLARNFLFAWFIPIVATGIIMKYAHSQIKRPFRPAYNTIEEDPVRKILKEFKHSDVLNGKIHPLNHNFTYSDEGWNHNQSNFIVNKYKV